MTKFEVTYRENYRKMFCVAHKVVGDKDVVSDIVQEVFVSYYEKLQNRHAINRPNSWLLRAVINKSVDYVNQQKKYVRLDAIQDNKEEDIIDKHQSEAVMQQALRRLNHQEMELVVLYSESFSYKEIAQITGIRFSSVGKTLSRSLNKLKEILKKMDDEMY